VDMVMVMIIIVVIIDDDRDHFTINADLTMLGCAD
jgi:hypothetical protein